ERAVSPVVGVTLLIGITVILASVVGVVVLGVDLGPAETPEATLSFEVTDSDEIVLRHEGGEPLDADEVVVVDESGTELAGLSGELRTGEQQEIASDASDSERISVVWRDPRSDSESVLATFRP
ncbi:MAG: type IV pilin, partial [Halobacteriota archaeon]